MPVAAKKSAKGTPAKAKANASSRSAGAKTVANPGIAPATTKATKAAKAPAKAAAAAKPIASAKPAAKPTVKTNPRTASRHGSATRVDPDARRHYIEVAAYYIAERRGFLDGCEMSDWCQAETEIDRMLERGLLSL